jgi:CxxC motif-containing protein (DUF1111 family)
MTALWLAWLVPAIGGWPPSAGAADPGPGNADREEAVRRKGEELFVRQWVPGDRRSRGGDGLGPVFNERSCLNCHDLGGTGGAGRADRNIELITPATGGLKGANPGFFYQIAFRYGPGGFEYRIGAPTATQANRAGKPDPQQLARLVQLHPGFGSAPAVLLHRYGNDLDYRTWREWLLEPHGTLSFRTSQRNPTPLFGLGMVDAIPDAVIEEGARRKIAGWPTVHGRVSRLADGRVGRFGWKGQVATLREFVLSAAARELGLELPGHAQAADPRIPPLPPSGLDLDQADCDALAAYVRALPAPASELPADAKDARALKAGKSLFKTTGCAACHLPKLGDLEGLYSDFLIHEMARELSDTASYGVFLAGPNAAPAPAAAPREQARDHEWRTPPLWGLRDSAPYLHDGRAATVDEAIRLHGGEAAAAAQRYRQLSPRERRQLERFLLSLTAPPALPAENLVRAER